VRTTLDIDDDLLAAAKHIARERGTTAGQVISELARQALKTSVPAKVRNGVPVFVPKRDAPSPDLRVVNELREDR
jgi:hypothetical protein